MAQYTLSVCCAKTLTKPLKTRDLHHLIRAIEMLHRQGIFPSGKMVRARNLSRRHACIPLKNKRIFAASKIAALPHFAEIRNPAKNSLTDIAMRFAHPNNGH